MQYLVKSQLWDVRSDAFVTAAVLLGLIFVVGVAGNGIVVTVITTLRRRGQKSSVQLFLLHLAVCDLLVCLLCIPLTIFTNFHYPTEYHKRDHGLCKISRFMQHLSPVMSVTLLTVISIDRYQTFVKQEFSCSQRSWYLKPKWLLFFAWMYGIVQTLPVLHTTDVISVSISNITVFYCTTTQASTASARIYLVASLILGFVIPLAIMAISYYRVIRVVWTRHRRFSSSTRTQPRDSITNSHLLERTKKRVLRVLLVVLIFYVVCWLPFALYHGILERYLKEPPNPMDAVRLITYGVGLANSTCNPFIYYFNVTGKSCHSLRTGFMELVGGRAETRSPGTVTTFEQRLSCAGFNRTATENIMELQIDPNSIHCTYNRTLDNNCV